MPRQESQHALTIAALVYPSWMLAAAIGTLPAIIRQALWHEPILRWEFFPFFISAQTERPGDPVDSILAGAVAVACAGSIKRWSRIAAGLLCAFAFLLPLVRLAVERQRLGWNAYTLSAVCGVFALALGARWIVANPSLPGRLSRIVWSIAGFALPIAAFAAASGRPRWLGGIPALTTLPFFVVAGMFHVRNTATGNPSWGLALCGLVLSAAIYGSQHWASEILRERDAAEAARALQSLPSPDLDSPYPKMFFQRGVTLVADRIGFGSAYTRQLVDRLGEQGVDSIALVAWSRGGRGDIRIDRPTQGRESDLQIEILTRHSRAKGIRVMLKPHAWRASERALPDENARRKYFAAHRAYVLHYADLARRIHADIFCIGTELAWLTRYEGEWRNLIRAIRDVYPGPITYASTQGPEFESIQFWDALDYIGLDNYHPLPDDLNMKEAGAMIDRVRLRFKKPVLFTEAGYSAFAGTHRKPWQDGGPEPLDLDAQARGYRAMLTAFYDKPWFAGVYWWKIDTAGRGGPDDNTMVPWQKPAMDVLASFYRRPRGIPE